jgi:signal transduction histidine kinase
VVVARVAAAGPCQVIGSFFVPPPWVHRLFGGVALLGLLVTAAGALATWLVVVRPLVQRIAALRRAAGLVGSEEGYTPPPRAPESPDDLDELGREMDRAHQRIVADAAALREKRHELRRHVENIAHDLKTPLSSLQLILEQAADEATPGAPLSDLVTAAIRDTVYLGGLTANLRLAAVLDDGFTPRKQPGAPLLEIVERATSRLSLLASRRGVELAVALPDRPIGVDADPLAAEQAISNVVENAVVHGAEGGHVSVLVRAEGPEFEILVMDDGPGVVDHDLPRLGERTFRSDVARQRDGRGQGLGLAITREVCRCFGWTLAFAKLDPEGFSVSLRGPRSTSRP